MDRKPRVAYSPEKKSQFPLGRLSNLKFSHSLVHRFDHRSVNL